MASPTSSTAAANVRSYFCKSTSTWTFLVADPATKKCALIDTVLDFDVPSGATTTDSADALIKIIEDEGLCLEWILETHVHADHLTASAYIKDHFAGGPKVAIGVGIKDVLAHWVPIFWGGGGKNSGGKVLAGAAPPLDGSQFDKLFADGEIFTIGSLRVKVIHTPGHTPACVTYFLPDANIAFVGDTIFMPEVGTARTDFPGGCPQILFDSCRALMGKHLNKDTIIHVGHDYPSKGKDPSHSATVEEHLEKNCMMNSRVSKDEFIEANKYELPVPRLLLPSLQVNLRAGRFGPEKALVTPLNLFNKKKHRVAKL